ncbi:PAS domain-containing protein [Rhizobium halophytocola]|uniref:PAS domain-containing protein n=1 Tax=Rhizobium halophytocola TaxID=735519 RepID=A0ABS4E5X0_9HYPH|nr:PAS domain-containing protein [Rhizobium halophytocola]
MPLRFDHIAERAFDDPKAVGLSPQEAIELMSAFRRCGYFRVDLETGLCYGTPDLFDIFGIEEPTGTINLKQVGERIHPDDLPMVLQSFERTSLHGGVFHSIYRVKWHTGKDYGYVRTCGRFRPTADGSGEIVGTTYEFFEHLRTAAFLTPGD